MPVNPNQPFNDVILDAFNPTGMSSAGSRVVLANPWRGYIKEVGFYPASLVASTTTMTVLVNASGGAASAFTQIVSSVLGSFTSQQLYEGAPASVQGLRAAVNPGDGIEVVTSGNLAAVGCTVYAIISRQ